MKPLLTICLLCAVAISVGAQQAIQRTILTTNVSDPNQFAASGGQASIKSGARGTNFNLGGDTTILSLGRLNVGGYYLSNNINGSGELVLLDNGNGVVSTFQNGRWFADVSGQISGSSVAVFTNSFMTLSNAQSQLTAIVAAMPKGSVYPWVSNDVYYLIIRDRTGALTTNSTAAGSGTVQNVTTTGTGITESGNGTSTIALSTPGFIPTNGLSISMLFSNSVTIRDSTGASVVISNGVIGTVGAITNTGNIQTATLNSSGAITAGGTGGIIANGGITNHATFDQFGRQTNYDVVIGTAQTNSGNIQSATLNTTGAAGVGGILTANGGITATGSNFIGAASAASLSYRTNLAIMSPDFTKGMSVIQTNAAFAFLQPIGIDTAKLTYQFTVTMVTNSTAAAVAITASANAHPVGTQFVTNVTQVLTDYYPPNGPTNQFFVPVF